VGYRKADDRKEAVLNADYIIHLAGNIAEKPWTNKRKSKSVEETVYPTYLPVLKEKVIN
jgi:NAD dependent epimerase/dehydratase family enzyme